ncbi:hypothetical protein KJ836_02695 [Patescibacteria group bacterium]|nr:hypothetical protein [Patescibacteria group bacterium]
MATIVDYYSESNKSSDVHISSVYNNFGQSFTANGGTLSSVVLYLKKTGSPTGNANIRVYAHSGTYGTSSVPTGTGPTNGVLATSDNYDVSTISTSYELVTFTFTGDNKISLTDGVNYCLAFNVSYSGIDYIDIGIDGTSPSHSGNYFYYDDDSAFAWVADDSMDMCFYVYKDSDVLDISYAGGEASGLVVTQI